MSLNSPTRKRAVSFDARVPQPDVTIVESSKGSTVMRKTTPMEVMEAFSKQERAIKKPTKKKHNFSEGDQLSLSNSDSDLSLEFNPPTSEIQPNTTEQTNEIKAKEQRNSDKRSRGERSRGEKGQPEKKNEVRPPEREKTKTKKKDIQVDVSHLGKEILLGTVSYTLVSEFLPHAPSACYAKWHHNSESQFSTASIDGTVTLIDAFSHKKELRFKAHESGLSDFCWSSSDQLLLTTSALAREIHLWNMINKKKLSTIPVAVGVTSLLWNPSNSNQCILGNLEGGIQVYQTDTCEFTDVPQDTGYFSFSTKADIKAPITCLESGFDSQKNQWLFTANAAGRLVVYQYSADYGFQYHNHSSTHVKITCITFSAKHQSILVNSSDNKLKLFSVPELELKKIYFHSQRVCTLRSCISSDGMFAITGSEGGTISVFNLEKGNLVTTQMISENNQAISSVVMSPDRRYLVTTCFDGKTLLWQAF